jgi:hypothetical protein
MLTLWHQLLFENKMITCEICTVGGWVPLAACNDCLIRLFYMLFWDAGHQSCLPWDKIYHVICLPGIYDHASCLLGISDHAGFQLEIIDNVHHGARFKNKLMGVMVYF